jgi:hypothetical protein
MDHPLTSCARKLDRAVAHFRSLHSMAGKYISDEEPFIYHPKIDMQHSRYVVRVEVDVPIPPELSLIAGDFIQNLRAALDHLVWQLVIANGQRPDTGNAFPIHSQKPTRKNRGLERWRRQTRGLHPAADYWIDQIQPYRRPNGPSRDPMTILARLSNEDKHRVVLSSVASVPHPDTAEPRMNITPISDVGPIKSYELEARKPLESGDVLLEAAIEITGPNPNIHLDGELPLEVAFGQVLIPVEGLVDLFDRVDVMVGHLANVTYGSELPPNPLGVRLGHETLDEYVARREMGGGTSTKKG